jgi:hypothetical protein
MQLTSPRKATPRALTKLADVCAKPHVCFRRRSGTKQKGKKFFASFFKKEVIA